MRIEDILQQKGGDVLTTTPEMTVVDAACIMSEYRIGLLVVCGESGKVLGVISERDIVRGVAEYPDHVDAMIVNDLATMDVATCEMGDHPEEVLRRMGEIGIRHMPVIQYGKLRGLISNRDLFRFLLQESEAGGKALQYNDFTFL
ncbi:MAG: CBS domain-containing protein [Rhodospirillales bacterium]|jgi:CBS domain-containing protein